MKVLVSVRSVDEALVAARAGVHFIDLKEPREGALGALPLPTIRAIVQALRRVPDGSRFTVSATVGDFPAHAQEAVTAQVHAVAGCGVDLVKVGVMASGDDAAGAMLRHLGTLAGAARAPLRLVPVLLADHGLDAEVVRAACDGLFAAVMVDTANKRTGSLLDGMDATVLRDFVRTVQSAGHRVGLAGALRCADVPRVRALGADFAGFRSAVCRGDRTQGLDIGRLDEVLAALRHGSTVAS